MQHAVDTGVHELLLVVMQVLGHILRHKHDVALHVNHEEKAIQGLQRWKRKCFTRVFLTQMQFNISIRDFENCVSTETIKSMNLESVGLYMPPCY